MILLSGLAGFIHDLRDYAIFAGMAFTVYLLFAKRIRSEFEEWKEGKASDLGRGPGFRRLAWLARGPLVFGALVLVVALLAMLVSDASVFAPLAFFGYFVALWSLVVVRLGEYAKRLGIPPQRKAIVSGGLRTLRAKR